MPRYRYIGKRADTLASGRPVEPGEFVNLTSEEAKKPHNESLIAGGKLIGVEKESKRQATLAEKRAVESEKEGEGV